MWGSGQLVTASIHGAVAARQSTRRATRRAPSQPIGSRTMTSMAICGTCWQAGALAPAGSRCRGAGSCRRAGEVCQGAVRDDAARRRGAAIRAGPPRLAPRRRCGRRRKACWGFRRRGGARGGRRRGGCCRDVDCSVPSCRFIAVAPPTHLAAMRRWRLSIDIHLPT